MSEDEDKRPRVLLIDNELALNADTAWGALMESRDPDDVIPPVMVRGNELARWTERGELEPYEKTTLVDHLSRGVRFLKYDKEGVPIATDPPQMLAEILLKRDSASYTDAPRVDRVVDVPVLGSSGKLVDEPGHHDADRLLYAPAKDLEGAVAGEIGDVDSVERARDFLMNELLGDFGFVDQASKANALALLLTPFVREFIGDSPTPMFLIVAPEKGTGKTLLAQAALTPACGAIAMTPETKNEEEVRKRITAALMTGTRAIVIDNIAKSVSSPVLAAAITSGVWTDRELGFSRQLTLPIRNVWVGTGNNLDLADEHMRCVVPIRLDPGDVNPAERSKEHYRHANLLKWARENRGALVAAALTLVNHWIEGEAHMLPSGEFERGSSRRSTDRTLGSFEQWADVVGGILAEASVDGFLGNLDQVGSLSTERADASRLIAAWHALDKEPMEARDLLALTLHDNPLHRDLGELEFPKAKHLGEWLKQWEGVNLDGLRVAKSIGRSGARLWSVV